tara:strand:- start:159 stop:446 length:288 start_codon:yes stop_codon:yes gene_type:complete
MSKNNNSTGSYLIAKHIDYIIPSLALVIALAWNSAFQKFFKSHKLLTSYGPWVYAILVTTVIIGIIQILEKTKAKLNNPTPTIAEGGFEPPTFGL